MSKYHSFSREIPVDDAFDIVVIGAGPAGIAAALAAARQGMRTLLVEQTGAPGGMATSGLVPSLAPYSDGRRTLYGGIALEILDTLKAGMPHVEPEAQNWVPIDPELLKRRFDALLEAAGVTVKFNATLVDAECDGNRIAHAVFADKGGLWGCSAKVFIDATGDADLAARAGVSFVCGDEKGELMPVTHCFVLANVDEYAFAFRDYRWDYAAPGSWRHTMLHSKKYNLTDGHTCVAHLGPGVFGFNAGHQWEVDPTRPDTVSAALREGRKIAAEFRNALAEFHPAFKAAFLVETASLIGVRESRRIRGEHELSFDDYRARREFPDAIARNSYPIDLHAAKNQAEQARTGEFDAMSQFENYKEGESHTIPYRSLIPQGISNLLVAGRAIACDRLLQASIRVMPNCLAMGEAAGVAAALVPAGGDVRGVDAARLREKLRANGCVL